MEEEKKLTPMKAIRAKCLDCCCGSSPEVKSCTIKKCPLWIYRSGHRPESGIKRQMTESQKNALRIWRENNSKLSEQN